MNKKISIGATIALMIISIALTISVTMVVAMRIFNSSVNDVTQRRAMYQYVTEIDTAVRPHYLGTIDEEKLRTALAQGYVDGIGDPYAAYLSASEYKAVQQTRSGKLTGYGIELSKTEDGMPQITEVSKQSPAASAGVQKGDIVVSLDGTEVTADTYDTVAEKLGVTTSGDKVLIGLGWRAVCRAGGGGLSDAPRQLREDHRAADRRHLSDHRNDGGGYLSDEQAFGHAGQQPDVRRCGAVCRCFAGACADDGDRQHHSRARFGTGLLYDCHRRCGDPSFGGLACAEKGRRN